MTGCFGQVQMADAAPERKLTRREQKALAAEQKQQQQQQQQSPQVTGGATESADVTSAADETVAGKGLSRRERRAAEQARRAAELAAAEARREAEAAAAKKEKRQQKRQREKDRKLGVVKVRAAAKRGWYSCNRSRAANVLTIDVVPAFMQNESLTLSVCTNGLYRRSPAGSECSRRRDPHRHRAC